jgi:hypothetical protein
MDFDFNGRVYPEARVVLAAEYPSESLLSTKQINALIIILEKHEIYSQQIEELMAIKSKMKWIPV